MTGYIHQTKYPFLYAAGDIQNHVVMVKNLEAEIAAFLQKINPYFPLIIFISIQPFFWCYMVAIINPIF